MKKFLLNSTAVVSSMFIVGGVHAATTSDVPTGVSPVTISGSLTISELLVTIINWVLGISGAIAVLFLIYGGILYITAAGNDKRAGQAKATILYAVIGLIVILLSFAIVTFLNTNASNVVN